MIKDLKDEEIQTDTAEIEGLVCLDVSHILLVRQLFKIMYASYHRNVMGLRFSFLLGIFCSLCQVSLREKRFSVTSNRKSILRIKLDYSATLITQYSRLNAQ